MKPRSSEEAIAPRLAREGRWDLSGGRPNVSVLVCLQIAPTRICHTVHYQCEKLNGLWNKKEKKVGTKLVHKKKPEEIISLRQVHLQSSFSFTFCCKRIILTDVVSYVFYCRGLLHYCHDVFFPICGNKHCSACISTHM